MIQQDVIKRWAAVGPYYAMFPVNFAFDVIEKYTQPGDCVLDPFVGRGSSIYAAAATERTGCGIEINPVGWLYSSVKLRPATKERVLKRLIKIGRDAKEINVDQTNLPIFFEWAYTPTVLRFLLAARSNLRWKSRESIVDRTLMAFILIHLHGKRLGSLSNQMRDSKAMAPDYSVRWWKKHNMRPPHIDPITFLEQRIERRYSKGRPRLNGDILHGDSIELLNSHKQRIAFASPFNLLFTSPPYHSVTNYHYDQWLRLWMLGHAPCPYWKSGPWQRKFQSKSDYFYLLKNVFMASGLLMSEDAIVVVRTDARKFTYSTTVETLKMAFPNKHLNEIHRPVNKKTQTTLYGDFSKKPGEIDIIMTPK